MSPRDQTQVIRLGSKCFLPSEPSHSPENSILKIITECTNSTKYTFGNIDECFEYFEKNPYRIIKMEIDIRLGEKYDSNRITMIFDNSESASTEIRFCFNNGDDYLLLKNKIYRR